MRIENRKARFDYEVVDTLEAGVILLGSEVKAIKAGQVSLDGSRVVENGGKLYVLGMHVPEYKFSHIEGYDPLRTKEILIKRSEKLDLATKKVSSGLTLVPLSVYNKGSLIKLEIGLVRGKKKYEKREEMKKKAINKELAKRLKQ
jgi:SsrA-binding protein